MKELSNYNLDYLFFIVLFLFSTTLLKAQRTEWEIDRLEKRAQEKALELDSTLLHLKDNWEIKLTFGKYYFFKSSQIREDDLFSPSTSTNIWQLTAAWHFRERLSANFNIGIQIIKDAPPSPDIFSVLNGNDIELDGSGVAFIPISIGLKYYFVQKRFRPLVGFNIGSVVASAKYIFVEGNINDGITTTEDRVSARTWLSTLYTGFDHRASKHLNFTFNIAYPLSGDFNQVIGGYLNYKGIIVDMGFSILF